jgi:hypothetical protein
MDLQLVEVRESGDFKNAFRAMSDAQTDALYVVSSRHTVLNMASMVDFARTAQAAEHRPGEPTPEVGGSNGKRPGG